MNSQPIGVFIILTKDNMVLLGKRKNAYKSGSHGCPGGRLELAESLIECATRELLEETGVRSTSFRFVGVIRELQEGYNFIHFAFECNKYDGDIRVMELEKCESWDYCPIDKLPTSILPAHKAGIHLLYKSYPDYVDILDENG